MSWSLLWAALVVIAASISRGSDGDKGSQGAVASAEHAAALTPPANEAPPYAILALPRPSGHRGYAFNLNNSGVAVGYYVPDGGRYTAMVYESSGSYHTVPPSTGALLTLHHINDNNEIVGLEDEIAFVSQGVFIDAAGNSTPMGTLGGDTSTPQGMNNVGSVTGYSAWRASYDQQPFVWNRAEGMVKLPNLDPNDVILTMPQSINDHEVIVGHGRPVENNRFVGVAWIDRQAVQLEDTGGGDSSSYYAEDVNNANLVVGYGTLAGDRYARGMLWDLNAGTLMPLPKSPDREKGYNAHFIDELNRIYGYMVSTDGKQTVLALWDTPESEPIEVGSRVPPRHRWRNMFDKDFEIRGVNDRGQMVGIGNYGYNGNELSYIITPIHPTLHLTPPTPGIAGRRNSITISNAPANTRVYLVAGPFGGGHYIPGCTNQENVLQIDNPQLAAIAVTDANGTATIRLNVPANLADTPILIQAFIRDTCEISNLVDVTFE